MEILTYLLKVNLAIAVFYLVYRICYRSDTFFTLRRYLLLSVCIISGIYPLLDISHWFRHNEVLNELAVIYVQYLPEFVITAPNATTKTFPYENIPLGIYAIIAGFFLIRLAFRLSKVIGLRIRCAPIEVNSRQAYLIQNQANPFSFFNWIFINPDNYNPTEMHEIVTHELVHVRQYHSIDILLSELMCIAFWFNPLAWMLKQEIHRNLEFLVDNRVIRSGIDSRSYQLNLLRLANNPSPILIANQFKKSPLKERIIMLNSKQTSKIKLVTYTLLLPMAFIILIAINAGSCINKNSGSQEQKSVTSDSQELKSDSDTQELKFELPGGKTYYTVVDEQPTFPGGDDARVRFLNETIRYPVVAQENGIQGRVTCSFIVEPDGAITNVHISRGADPSLDRETMRVIGLMPRWNPGKLQGVAVPVLYSLPVQFRLQQ
jgi:TonB family protein